MREMTMEEYIAIPHSKDGAKLLDDINMRLSNGEYIEQEEFDKLILGPFRIGPDLLYKDNLGLLLLTYKSETSGSNTIPELKMVIEEVLIISDTIGGIL